SAYGPHVAVLIAGGRADEGDVDMDVPLLNGPDTAAVGTHDGVALQLAGGDGFADLAPDAGGLDAGDGAVLDHGNDGVVGLAQGAGADGDVFNAHLVHFLHNHVHHIVAFPEMMMEGQ